MKEKLKGLRLNVTGSAIVSIVIGILFLINPTSSIAAIGKLLAAIVVIAGIVVIVSQITENRSNVMGYVVGGVIVLIGIWMFASPGAILTIIPIAIGVLIVLHGVQDLKMAIEASSANASRTWVTFAVSIVTIILGFVCIAFAFNFVSLTFRVIGIILIFDGLSDLGIVMKVNRATGGVVDSKITSEEDIF